MESPNGKQKYKHSRQRERILQVLNERHDHPTADEIYKLLKPEFPRLSLGTVYRNLRILEDQHKISEVKVNGNFGRFEGKTEAHYHFVCRKCDHIQDLDLPIDPEMESRVKMMTGAEIEKHTLNFYGTCSECKEKEPAEL